MKSAKEWLVIVEDRNDLWRASRDSMLEFFEAIQRDALDAAIAICHASADSVVAHNIAVDLQQLKKTLDANARKN